MQGKICSGGLGMNTSHTLHVQSDAYSSPWTKARRLRRALWVLTWSLLCRWTPKPLNFWRLVILRLWGAKIPGHAFVHASVRIHFPDHLNLGERACLGERVNVYNLAPVSLGAAATVAQETFLCTGTHDFHQAHLPLKTSPIVIEKNAFVGARAFILPGITVGAGAIVGAGAVVTRDVEANHKVAGNPARVIGTRSGCPRE